jgi:hypothetical protein
MATGPVTIETYAVGIPQVEDLESCFNEVTYACLWAPAFTIDPDSIGTTGNRPTRNTTGITTRGDFSAVGGPPGALMMVGEVSAGVMTSVPVPMTFLLPREWDQGTTVRPVVTYSRLAAGGGTYDTATVGFLCTYQLAPLGSAAGACVTITSHSCGIGNSSSATQANLMWQTRFPAIAASTLKVGEEFRCVFERDKGSSGSAAGTIAVHGVGLIYKLSERTLGSDLEVSADGGTSSPKTGS